jgi:hypothetical protein
VLLNLASQMNPARQLKPASHLRLAGFSGCVLSSAVLSHALHGTARRQHPGCVINFAAPALRRHRLDPASPARESMNA